MNFPLIARISVLKGMMPYTNPLGRGFSNLYYIDVNCVQSNTCRLRGSITDPRLMINIYFC